MPCSHDASLQERERGLDGVGMNVSINVVVAAMLNRLVLALRHASALHGERSVHHWVRKFGFKKWAHERRG
jgi:hypothetical protein